VWKPRIPRGDVRAGTKPQKLFKRETKMFPYVNIFEPDADQIHFHDAAKIVENGYAPLPLPWKSRNPMLPFAVGRYFFPTEDILNKFGDEGIAVACAVWPALVADLGKGRNTWVVAVDVTMSNKKIAKAVDELVRNAATAAPAVRHTTDTYNRLYVFKYDALNGQPFVPSMSTRLYQMPKDVLYHSVRVLNVNENFAHSGHCTKNSMSSTDPDGPAFYWPAGDLTKIQRASLPVITAEGSDALREDIEQIFETLGAERVM
jgi:hypothetical protein